MRRLAWRRASGLAGGKDSEGKETKEAADDVSEDRGEDVGGVARHEDHRGIFHGGGVSHDGVMVLRSAVVVDVVGLAYSRGG